MAHTTFIYLDIVSYWPGTCLLNHLPPPPTPHSPASVLLALDHTSTPLFPPSPMGSESQTQALMHVKQVFYRLSYLHGVEIAFM